MNSWLTAEEREALVAPFPHEAHQRVEKQRGVVLTTVKAAYVIERMHKTFGHGNFVVTGRTSLGTLEGIMMNKRDFQKTGAAPLYGNRPYIRFDGDLVISDGKGGVRQRIPCFGLRELDGVQDWEDTAKSCRTNAICKSLFENLLVGLDVFKGLYTWSGNSLVVNSPEAKEEKAKEEQAAIQARRFLKEMQDFGKESKENLEEMKALVVSFKQKNHGLTFSKIEELGTADLSRLYWLWKNKE